MNFARDIVEARRPQRPRARRARPRRRAARVDLRRGRAPAAARARRAARRARRAPRRRRPDARRQPPRVGAGDGRLLPPGLRRAALHRAAAAEGPAPAPRGRAARARRLRRAQRAVLREAGWSGPTVWVPGDGDGPSATPPPARRARPRGPVPDHLHERHRRRAEGRRPRPALPRRPAPAGRALARRPPRRARLVHGGQRLEQVGPQRRSSRRGCAARRRCCTTSASTPTSAWRSSTRSPSRSCAWRRRSTASSPSAPSRARRRALRGLVAAGEALNPEVLRAWHEATGLWVRDGYGQTETGQITGMPLGRDAVPGSMGRPLPGVDAWVDDGELVARPGHGPDLLPRLPRRGGAGGPVAHRRPRHPGRRRLPLLRGPRRRRHHLARATGSAPSRSSRPSSSTPPSPRPRSSPPPTTSAAPSCAPSSCCATATRPGRARARAAGPRQGPDGALQVPAHRRLRRRAAQDGQRQGPPRRAAGRVDVS